MSLKRSKQLCGANGFCQYAVTVFEKSPENIPEPYTLFGRPLEDHRTTLDAKHDRKSVRLSKQKTLTVTVSWALGLKLQKYVQIKLQNHLVSYKKIYKDANSCVLENA